MGDVFRETERDGPFAFSRWLWLVLGLVFIASPLAGQEGATSAPAAGPDPLASWLAKPESDRVFPTTATEVDALLKQVQSAQSSLDAKRAAPELPAETKAIFDDLAASLGKLNDEFTAIRQRLANRADSPGFGKAAGAERQAALRKRTEEARRAQRDLEPKISGLRKDLAEAVFVPDLPSEKTVKEAKAALDEAEARLQDAQTNRSRLIGPRDAIATTLRSAPDQLKEIDGQLISLETELNTRRAKGETGYAVEALEERVYLLSLRRDSINDRLGWAKDRGESEIFTAEVELATAQEALARLERDEKKRRFDAIQKRLIETKQKEADAVADRDGADPRLAAIADEYRVQVRQLALVSEAVSYWSDYFNDERGEFRRLDSTVKSQMDLDRRRSEDVDRASDKSHLERERTEIRERLADVEGARNKLIDDLAESRSRMRDVRRRIEELEGQVDFENQESVGTLEPEEKDLRKERDQLLQGYRSEFAEHRKLQTDQAANVERLTALVTRIRVNLRAINQRIRWSREDSAIDGESLSTAFADLRHELTQIRAWPGRLSSWVSQLFASDGNSTRIAIAAALIALALLAFRLIQRRLPTTYAWLEERSVEAEGSRLFRVGGILLRRTNFSFFLALIFVGIPWVCGLTREVVGLVAAIFATPFFYRLGRVILDVAFAPDNPEGGLVPLDETLSRLFHRAGRYLLNLALFFVPMGVLMGYFGYADENPGFVELWWLVYKTLSFAILLFAIFRPVVLKRLIRGDGVLATSFKSWIFVLYPIVVGVILFLMILTSLRFETAERFFRNLFLASGALLLTAYLGYRFLLRKLVKSKDVDTTPNADAFATPEEYDEASRRNFVDRTLRLVLRLAFLVPVVIFMRELWSPVDFDALNLKLWGEEPDPVRLGDMTAAILAIVATVVAARLLRGLVNHVFGPMFKLEQGLRYTAMTLTGYAIMTLGAIVFLNILQVKGSQIALVTSALVFGIGFGLQSIVRNFISGLILLIERPVRVGDRVDVGGNSGAVDKITLRATRVMTWEGVGIVIPNEQLIDGTLVNHSLGIPRLRTTLTFGVAYGSDLSLVRETVHNIVSGHGLVLKRPPPEVFFVGFGDSSLNFEVRFWTTLETFRLRVASDMRFAIDAAFRKLDIEIPFPQRDVTMTIVKENGDEEDVPLPEELDDDSEKRDES
jgi:small-conductance mechanosensitive channel